MVFEKLQALLAEKTGKDASEITNDTAFEALGIDSLDTVELVMELEEELDVEIELDDKVTTVGEFVSFVESKIS